jgi:hypothetical protein
MGEVRIDREAAALGGATRDQRPALRSGAIPSDRMVPRDRRVRAAVAAAEVEMAARHRHDLNPAGRKPPSKT